MGINSSINSLLPILLYMYILLIIIFISLLLYRRSICHTTCMHKKENHDRYPLETPVIKKRKKMLNRCTFIINLKHTQTHSPYTLINWNTLNVINNALLSCIFNQAQQGQPSRGSLRKKTCGVEHKELSSGYVWLHCHSLRNIIKSGLIPIKGRTELYRQTRIVGLRREERANHDNICRYVVESVFIIIRLLATTLPAIDLAESHSYCSGCQTVVHRC